MLHRPSPSADTAWLLLFAAWLVAGGATLGALFFSEVMNLPPCVLCWYQRIAMFPLVLLLPMGLFPFDARLPRQVLPLTLAGWAVALYHWLIVLGLVPETLQPCTQGIPCAEVQIQWLGFVTLPLLSLIAFTLVNALLLAAHLRSPR